MKQKGYGIKHFGDLLVEITKREIKARYKQSVLGYAWVVFVPLLNLVVLTLVFSYFVRIPTGGIPYPVFLFIGLIPWTFTSSSLVWATSSLVSNRSLITKVYLPTEVFPISTIITKFIDFLLSIIVGIILILIFRVNIQPLILYFPLILIVQILITLGVSLMFSALNVFYRDIENVMGVMVTIWMYLSPVLYPQELIPNKWLAIYNLNPMAPILSAYRNTLLYGVAPSWTSFTYAIIVSVLVFVIGLLFFKHRSRYFADVI
jgi:lipopolysaccharide transport system permease protein